MSRGYIGHAPAGRPQGEPDLDQSGHSDDVPLLFSPISNMGSNFHSSQELEPPAMSHCHGEEPSRDASRTASKRLKLAMGLSFLFLVGFSTTHYLSIKYTGV